MTNEPQSNVKPFDCVDMKRKAQEEIARQLEGMNREQQIEYWKRRSEEFRKELEQAKASRKAG